MDNSVENYKFVLIGDSTVGKTNLLTQYVDGKTSENFISTIGIEFKNKTVELKDGRKIRMQIWDTSGQEKFRALTKNYFRGCDVALFVFDVTNKASFDNIKEWLNLYNDVNGKNSIRILIGNKIDKENRVVNKKDLEDFAKEKGLTSFEISVKDKEKIDEMFKKIVQLLLKENKIEEDNFINNINSDNEIKLTNNKGDVIHNSNNNIERRQSMKLNRNKHAQRAGRRWC